MTNLTLNNEQSIPILGLGTFRAKGDASYRAVKHALESGYRHVDTAVIYGNEEEVGRGIADSGVDRGEIFLTSKIWNGAHTTEAAAKMVDESLARLGTSYHDLLLIHWPGSYERNAAVWKAMEDAVDAGKVRSIGISNFNIHHISALLETARIKPAVNQMECHIELQNARLQKYMEPLGIALEAYAPFMSQHIGELLENKTMVAIGDAHGKKPTQVALRWLIQRGVIAIPKSVTPERIEENLNVFDFELADDEMLQIRKLNRARRIFPEPDNIDSGFVSF